MAPAPNITVNPNDQKLALYSRVEWQSTTASHMSFFDCYAALAVDSVTRIQHKIDQRKFELHAINPSRAIARG